jgi:hypothetical protein
MLIRKGIKLKTSAHMTNAKQDVANAPDSRTGMKKYDGMCYRLARRRDTVVYYCSTYYKADRLLDPSDPSDASDISGMSDNKFVSHRGKVAQDRAGPEPGLNRRDRRSPKWGPQRETRQTVRWD